MVDLIPDGWTAGALPDYAEINPRLIQRSELEDDTQVSFIRMEDVSSNAIVKNVRVVPYKQVSKGFTTFQNADVLLAKITPCFENGKGGFVGNLNNGVGFGSTEFHVLRAKKNSDAGYIYQFTNYPDFRIKGAANMTGSAGQRRVPTDYLKTCDVVFPPLPEQQKIATILSSVDDVIEKTRAQIDKLKDLKTGMMQELLTKGIGHTEFKDSPVGRIPASWTVGLLEDLCVLQRGFDLPVQDRQKGDVPILGSNGIVGRHNQAKVLSPAVITGRSGSLGDVLFVVEDCWPLNTSLYIKDFKGNDEKFVFYFLQHFNLKKYGTGTGVPTLNRRADAPTVII